MTIIKYHLVSLCGNSWDSTKMISLLKIRISKFINLSLELEKIYQETFPNHLKPRLYLGEEKTTRQGIYISLHSAQLDNLQRAALVLCEHAGIHVKGCRKPSMTLFLYKPYGTQTLSYGNQRLELLRKQAR